MSAHERARRSDSRASVEAARRSNRASGIALKVVEAIMRDRVHRIDEEIWRAAREQGLLRTADTIRHARKTLSDVGLLLPQGENRRTSNDCWSMVWAYNPKWGKKK